MSTGKLIERREPLSRGWHRSAIKDGQVQHGLYYYGEATRRSLLSTLIDGRERRRRKQRQRLQQGFINGGEQQSAAAATITLPASRIQCPQKMTCRRTNDCEVFAIVFAMALANNIDPCECCFKQDAMMGHLQ